MSATWTILEGDCRDRLAELDAGSVQTCVTSPPYFGLRDYGHDGQIGLEPTPDEFVAALVGVFREVRRVLRDDGTVWLNLGDSYAGGGGGNYGDGKNVVSQGGQQVTNVRNRPGWLENAGVKPKDLLGIPWAVAQALRAPYYTGTIRDERDRIWLAAMIDAEGCMFIHKRKAGSHNGQGYYRKQDQYGAGLEISSTDHVIVERVMQIVGRGSICEQGPDQNARRRQTIYRWNLRSNECREVVREVYPYLVAKQHEARLLIGCPPSGAKAEATWEALKAIHQGGSRDVDFPAPASMFEPGWYLRSDVIWSKANPMPESVQDRPTKAHEYLFLLSKAPRYFYDADAIREANEHPNRSGTNPRLAVSTQPGNTFQIREGERDGIESNPAGRNRRSVWTVATQPYPGAHFATFPPKLIEPCILAGCPERACSGCGAPWTRILERTKMVVRPTPKREAWQADDDHARTQTGGTMLEPPSSRTTGWEPSCDHDAPPVPGVVLDPFAGAGTTGMVALRHGRSFVGIELSAEYVRLARDRIIADAPLLNTVAEAVA